MGAIWKRSQRRPCASWQKKISDRLDLWKESATSATCKRSQRRPCASWQKNQWHAQPWKNSATGATWEKVSDVRTLTKQSATDSRELAKNISDGRDLGKKITDVRNMKKKSATALSELTKKSVTCATLDKLSDGGDLGKSQRCAHIDKEVSDGFVRAGKKYQRWARSGRKVGDMRNQGHNQRQARPVKKFRDGRNLKKSSATGLTWEKINALHIERRAQIER